MRKIITILAILLMAFPASAQHYNHDSGYRYEQHHGRDDKRHDRKSGRDRKHRSHKPKRNKSVHRTDIRCSHDWQELWNGCHVRIKLDKIYIYDRYDKKVLSGEEVTLLRNGCYKVYNGAFWHVHAPNGERVSNIWGDRIDLMSNGVFRCYRAGGYVYYDPDGRERL